MKEHLSLMLVAGETSGDAHAAALVKELRAAAPEVEFDFFGGTGVQMRAAGIEELVATDQLGIIGLIDELKAMPRFWRAFQDLKRAGRMRRPDAVILIDWPDFNLRLARAFKRMGLRVIYYVSPQLWAWRSHRVRNVRRDVDLLLAILPFEPEWYAARGVRHVEFIGHPLTGEVGKDYDRAAFCAQHKLTTNAPLIALLPGSRHHELTRIAPVMFAAVEKMLAHNPALQFVLPVAANRRAAEIDGILAPFAPQLKSALHLVHGAMREAVAAADAAAVTSGTATLETALLGTPLVVVYKTAPLSWHTLRHLINVEHYGLINLIAGTRLAAELIQNDFTPDALAAELTRLLEPNINQQMRARLHETIATLGNGGASRNAAAAILRAVRAEPD